MISGLYRGAVSSIAFFDNRIVHALQIAETAGIGRMRHAAAERYSAPPRVFFFARPQA